MIELKYKINMFKLEGEGDLFSAMCQHREVVRGHSLSLSVSQSVPLHCTALHCTALHCRCVSQLTRAGRRIYSSAVGADIYVYVLQFLGCKRQLFVSASNKP